MKLGYSVGYWSSGPPVGALEAIQEADRLRFDSVWSAEAHGSDAFTPLAWWGSKTERLRLGTGIVQLRRAHLQQRRWRRSRSTTSRVAASSWGSEPPGPRNRI